MKRWIVPAICLLFIASSSAFGAGAYQLRAYTSSAFEIAINGVSIGQAYSFEGGDARANSVVVSNPVGTAPAKKHIAGVSYAPITVEVSFPPSQPILDWMSDFFANRQTRKTVLITQYDLNYSPVGKAMQANNVLLTEVRFPALDAAAKDTLRLTLVMSPESVQAVVPAAAPTAIFKNPKVALAANFSVQIGSLPTSRVSKVESLIIKQPIAQNSVGTVNQFALAPGNLEFSNLLVTISSTDIAAWNTWRDDFVVNGQNSDANEISGSITLNDATSKPYLTLQFSNIGIMRASPLKHVASTDTIARFQAELYFESVAFGTPPAQPLTALPVAFNSATAVPLSTAAATTASSAATNTADQGARDLKDFPRPDGTVRKSFSSIFQKTYQQDTADYTSKETLDNIEEFFKKNLTSAGWALNRRVENNGSALNTHQVVMTWENGMRSAILTIWELKTAGSEYTVNETTKLAP